MGFSPKRVAEVPAAAWRGLRQAGDVSWATRAEYVRVVVLACVTEVAVRTVPLPMLSSVYGVSFGLVGPAAAGAPSLEDLPAWAVRRLRVVVRVMRRWPVQGECLRHALVAGQRVRALHPELRLGVAREEGAVIAHAWLVIGGKSLDPTSGRYAELRPPG